MRVTLCASALSHVEGVHETLSKGTSDVASYPQYVCTKGAVYARLGASRVYVRLK